MKYEDYMKEYYKEKYGTEDYPKNISNHMGVDFANWMNHKLIEAIIELNRTLMYGKTDNEI